MGDTTNSTRQGEELGMYLNLLGATDGTDMGALRMEYDHRHGLSWVGTTAGINTFSKPLTVSDSANLTGALGMSGAVNMSGATTFSGTQTGRRQGGYLAISGEGTTADSALTTDQSGVTCWVTITGATAALTVTLPSTVAGVKYTFIKATNTTAADLRIAPASVDKFIGVGITALDGKVYASEGSADAVGDLITIVGDGTDGWLVVDERGTWARET